MLGMHLSRRWATLLKCLALLSPPSFFIVNQKDTEKIMCTHKSLPKNQTILLSLYFWYLPAKGRQLLTNSKEAWLGISYWSCPKWGDHSSENWVIWFFLQRTRFWDGYVSWWVLGRQPFKSKRWRWQGSQECSNSN